MVIQHVVAPPSRAGMFLVFSLQEGAETQIRQFLADAPGLVRGVSFRYPADQLLCVLGLGAGLWDRLYAAPRPAHLHPFAAIEGERHTAVSTPGDLLVHLRADHIDICFEMARQVEERLRGFGQVVDEVHGFKFFDDRDLLGFVDGTENPEGAKAVAAVTVGAEDSGYAGSSYVIVQKYLHDLDGWRALSTEDQERAIGRSKLEDIEMPEERKPSNSHVALNTITAADGTQRQIFRENMPFGAIGTREFGTYFIGYAADPGITEEMLRNMFLGKPAGNTDRILDFSTPVTGSLYFVPTEAFLDDQPPGRAEDGPGH
ncbi:MAG: Dyp-type peroxidase [Tetrasphaera sp.]